MANTPQAKKRIRRNATRQTINHSRVSRIRTFIKAVESAIAVGQEGGSRRGAEGGPAGDVRAALLAGLSTRTRPRGNFPGYPSGLRRSAKTVSKWL